MLLVMKTFEWQLRFNFFMSLESIMMHLFQNSHVFLKLFCTEKKSEEKKLLCVLNKICERKRVCVSWFCFQLQLPGLQCSGCDSNCYHMMAVHPHQTVNTVPTTYVHVSQDLLQFLLRSSSNRNGPVQY